jgi:hypothetical protein
MRLTPVTLIGKASEQGLGEVGRAVLAPYFHQAEQESKKVSAHVARTSAFRFE